MTSSLSIKQVIDGRVLKGKKPDITSEEFPRVRTLPLPQEEGFLAERPRERLGRLRNDPLFGLREGVPGYVFEVEAEEECGAAVVVGGRLSSVAQAAVCPSCVSSCGEKGRPWRSRTVVAHRTMRRGMRELSCRRYDG